MAHILLPALYHDNYDRTTDNNTKTNTLNNVYCAVIMTKLMREFARKKTIIMTLSPASSLYTGLNPTEGDVASWPCSTPCPEKK